MLGYLAAIKGSVGTPCTISVYNILCIRFLTTKYGKYRCTIRRGFPKSAQDSLYNLNNQTGQDIFGHPVYVWPQYQIHNTHLVDCQKASIEVGNKSLDDCAIELLGIIILVHIIFYLHSLN